MRGARHGPLAHDVERPLRLAEPAHRVVDATAAEPLLGEHEAVAGLTDQVVGRHAAVAEHGSRRGCPRRPYSTSGCAIVPMSRTISMPGVPVGHDEHRRVAVRPTLGIGLGEHQHDVGHRGVGDEPLVAVDHPLVAVLRRGRADDGRVGAGEERLGEGERAGDLAAEVGPQPALLLRLGCAVGQQLHVPAVGCLHAEDRHRHHAAADDLRHQRQLQLPEPGAAELRIEERAPQTLRLHPVLQVALDGLPLVRAAAGRRSARAGSAPGR